MPARKNPKTAFGLELLQFCARNGITYKQVAAAADVKHSTLVECTTGRCAGHELIPKVRRYMEDYEASISTNRTYLITYAGKSLGEKMSRNKHHLDADGNPILDEPPAPDDEIHTNQ